MSASGPSGLFSIPAFFIVFRETLEAAVVVSVLMGVLKKTGLDHLKKHVWSGVGIGLAVTAAMMIAAVIGLQYATEAFLNGLSGNTEDETELAQFKATLRIRAGLSFSAGILVALMCWTLDGILYKQKQIEKHVMDDANNAVSKKEAVTWWTVFFLSLTTVIREGAETIIFLSVTTGFEVKSVPIPLVTGMIAGSLAGLLLYKAGSRLALVWFFRVSVVFLSFVGAGIFTHGLEEIWQLKDRGEGLGWWGELVYNISACCGLRFQGWSLFRALFGYTPYPSRLEMVGYFGYFIVLFLGFAIKWQIRKREIDVGAKFKNVIRKMMGKPPLEEHVQQVEDDDEVKNEIKELSDYEEDLEKKVVIVDAKAAPAEEEGEENLEEKDRDSSKHSSEEPKKKETEPIIEP